MSNYVVTNIRLPEEDYLRLKEEAARARKSLSAVIRERVGTGIKKLSRKEWVKKIQTLNTSWFTEKDYGNYKKVRREWEERLKRYNW